MKTMIAQFQLLAILILLSFSIHAQDAEKDKKEKDEGPKQISEIIKSSAITEVGLFSIHQQADKLYFEIPDSLLGVEMLLVSRIAKVPSDLSPFINAGSKVGEQVIVWEKNANKILLKVKSYQSVSDEEDPINISVSNNNFEPIIAGFKIEGINATKDVSLIDATKLFNTDIKALSGLDGRFRKSYKVKSLDKTRSFVESARSFPINIEVKHVTTFVASEPPSKQKTETLSLLMNQSFILLPKEKMQARLYDKRVGWFTTSQVDYSSEALKADEKTYIRRWKLIPKDIEAYMRGELVEPEQQIVYYLDPATPLKWRPYFKQGIEDWNACFETAGFKNVVVAKDPPTKEEDPDFSPEDARFSVVRYVASKTRNAVGPSVSDPRTGEIIESDIIWYHNHLRSYRNRYMIETGAANPAAQGLDTPLEEIGEMIRRVISHEVGHALGLPHNMKASAAYPVDSLRSSSFTHEFGIATTIMDYARYNYVAQPGDENIRFIRKLGPYDHYSVNYGYRYLPESTEDEYATLQSWIDEKAGDPKYAFGSGRGRFDPHSQTECIGDDNIRATEYGLQNLKRVAPKLIEWTTRDGSDYSDLEEIYGEFLGVWTRYMGHVAGNVGGVYEELKMSEESGAVYTPVPREIQASALDYLSKEAFSTQTWLMPRNISARISEKSSLSKVASAQNRVLNSLLSTSKLDRIADNQFTNGNNAFGLESFFNTLHKAVWDSNPDQLKRMLQRNYVKRLHSLLKPPSPSTNAVSRRGAPRPVTNSDLFPMVRAELEAVYKMAKRNSRGNGLQAAHFADIMRMIELGEQVK